MAPVRSLSYSVFLRVLIYFLLATYYKFRMLCGRAVVLGWCVEHTVNFDTSLLRFVYFRKGDNEYVQSPVNVQI